MERDDFHIGQMLFIAYDGHRGGGVRSEELPITAIGRKWLTVGEGWKQERVDIERMFLDGKGYTSPGRAYLSREDWEMSTAAGRAWDEFRRNLGYARPEGVTVEDIETVKRLLRMP